MKTLIKYTVFVVFYLVQVKVHAWEIDLSRRQVDFQKVQNIRLPASVVSVDPYANTDMNDSKIEVVEAIKRAVTPVVPAKDIVIAQTENGFIPETIHIEKGVPYQIHIVNLNHKEKNVSFLMDSFSQSHNTVYGLMKQFQIIPNVEGVFSYQSPETGASGKLVVVGDKVRKVASDDKN